MSNNCMHTMYLTKRHTKTKLKTKETYYTVHTKEIEGFGFHEKKKKMKRSHKEKQT